ncbi:MAG: enamine deaminase RidA [Glaciihabitans sp.]|jgi:2-iminobutanoate/2-iminopropanoate deaminase|nr:enamine deaminase RidA [Glaciihabitans sp.]
MSGEDVAGEIQVINAQGLVAPLGHYSHVSTGGGVAYISGQLPVTSEGKPITDRPFAEQVAQTLANLGKCLAASGLDNNDLLQVRVYVTDIANWPEFDEIYSTWMGQHRPARAVAGVKELHYGSAVEIEAVALLRRS